MTEITEIVRLDAKRVDAVKTPANGFPILLMKALAAPDPVSKDAMNENETSTTSTEEVVKETEVSPNFDELVKSAVAEATRDSEQRIKALEERLAKVLETPVPGGPVMTAPAHMRDTVQKAEKLAEAARFAKLADEVTDPDLKRFYKERADTARSAA